MDRSAEAQVFNEASYRDFLVRLEQLWQEYARIHKIYMQYPTKAERMKGPENSQLDALQYQIKMLMDEEYHRQLPLCPIARCPYCGKPTRLPVDQFSLFGFHPDTDPGRYGRVRSLRRDACKHLITVTVAIGLNDLHPDDLPWMLRYRNWMMMAAPHIMVWPLLARHTSAVMHSLPIARLDKQAHYSAYFSAYFAADDSNMYDEALYVHTDIGTPATDGVYYDEVLLKWVNAGRILWLDGPDAQLVQQPVEKFPYASISPRGIYQIQDGKVVSMKPIYHVYQGAALPHEDSLSRSIEL